MQFLKLRRVLRNDEALGAERRKMIKSTTFVFILLLVPIIIGLEVRAQPQPDRNNTRQVGNMLHRLERSSIRFRNSLNVTFKVDSVRSDWHRSGAGSVFILGKDNLELPSGTALTIRSNLNLKCGDQKERDKCCG